MGTPINRRSFLLTMTAFTVITPVRAAERAFRDLQATGPVETGGLKVGPVPRLPNLPRRPYPYPGYFLLTDGRIAEGGGFCWTMYLGQWVKAGFARDIPYGLAVRTDQQKLWLLGRTSFTPKLTEEIMTAHRNDPLISRSTTN